MVAKFFVRLFIFFVILAGLSLILTPPVSGNGGMATPPFIVDGIVRNMVKQPGYVGSTYAVESRDWGMTFQVLVEPGHGTIDDSIRVGDGVQVCGERGTGTYQTQIKINRGNHYIRRTGLAASPLSKQPEVTQTPSAPASPDSEFPPDVNTKDRVSICGCTFVRWGDSYNPLACIPRIKTKTGN